jgi:RNA recognition motif-containing protein
MYALHMIQFYPTTSFFYQINPSTTETDVQEFFEGCGPIRSVQISCGQGQGTTVGMAIPKPVRRTRDSQHAFVVFEERASVFKALECNGRRLRNWPVSISVRAQDVAPGVPKPRVVKPPRKR